MGNSHYIIRGGVAGRDRLRILSRLMQPSTHNLLERAGLRPGMSCLEIGCGSGDLAFDMVHMVGPFGRVLGTDIDETKIRMAREEAAVLGLTNIEFRYSDITKEELPPEFDMVHARFVLTHLPDPAAALETMRRALRPGGIVVVEDIDFRGCFCHPDCPAYFSFVDLYSRTTARRGGDANIGPRLPGLLSGAGFRRVGTHVTQLAATEGDVKRISPITMENIAESVVAEGFATAEEVDEIVENLYAFAESAETVMSVPRVVEAWGVA